MLENREITVKRNILQSLGGALGIHAGEGEPFLLMFGQAFFLGIMMITFYTAANTLFLVEFGAEAFPYVYLASAAAIIVVGVAFARLESSLPFPSLLVTTTLFMIVTALLLWAGLRFAATPWIVFVAMVWMRLLWVISNLVLWALLGRLFNVRQGKRLFTLVLAGPVLAFITFGLSTSLLIRLLGIVSLMLIAGLSLIPGLWLLIVTLRKYRSTITVRPDRHDQASPDGREPEGYASLLKSRYVLLFFVFTALSTIATYVLDFGYLTEAAAHFVDSERLGSFFGSFIGVSMIVLLLIALVSGRIFDRFGMAAGLLFNPIMVGIGALVIALTGTFLGAADIIFWLVVATKLVDDIMVTMNNAGRNILYQPLPTGQRVKVQTAVESMIQPAFVGVVGIILLAFQALGNFSTVFIYYLLIAIILGWLIAGVWLNREYAVQLKGALARRRLSRDAETHSFDSTGLFLLQGQLASPRAGVVIYAMDVLSANDPAALLPALSDLLNHAMPEVRSHVLAKIEEHRLAAAQKAVRDRLAVEQNASIKGAILRTLAALGDIEPVAAVLTEDDCEVLFGAITGLLLHGGLEGMLHALQKLLALVTSPRAAERELAARLLAEVGVSSFYQPVQRLLDDEDAGVQRAALKAAGRLRSPVLWSLVMEKLRVPALRGPAASALAMGGENVVPLITEVLDAQSDPAVVAQLAHVLGRIKGEQATAALKRMLDKSAFLVRSDVCRALSRSGYQAQESDANSIWQKIQDEIGRAAWLLGVSVGLDSETVDSTALDLLRMALKHEFTQVRNDIMLLLSFVYEPQVMHDIGEIFALQDATEREKADAIETLDIMLSQDMKKRVFPLLGDHSPAEQLKQLRAVGSSHEGTLTLRDLLEKSADQEKPWLIACALYAAGASERQDLRQLLPAHVKDGDELIRETAAWTMERLQRAREALQAGDYGKAIMLSTIERVLFLKGMELFDVVPGEDLVAVAKVAHEVRFASGTTLVKQGEIGDSLYFILDGEVQIMVDEGQEVAKLGPESVLGEMSILSRGHRTASAVAVTEISALKIDRQDFKDLMVENPELSQGIIKVLVRRLEDANRKLAQAAPEPAA
jgi:HEAT repeat protein